MVQISAVIVEGTGLRVGEQKWAWRDIESVTQNRFVVVGSVTVSFTDGSELSAWGWPKTACILRTSIQSGLATWAEGTRDEIRNDLGRVRDFLERDCYLTRHAVREFMRREKALFEGRLTAVRELSARGWADAVSLRELTENFDSTVARRNATWSHDEQERWRELFDTVERTPLTAEQRKAVVDFDNRNLLVAAAGSGKSSTVVAKVAYAVRKGLFEPREIVALTFNKHAATELQERIRNRLKDIPRVKEISSTTFHALALKMLTTRQKSNIEDDPKRRIHEAYEYLKASDIKFRRAAVMFVLNYTPEIRVRSEFGTFEEYELYVRTVEGRGGSKGRRVRTLSGHHVASLEEMKIANWLFTHCVPFEYEKSYPHNEATRERRGYTPDFYYPEIDVWHEHFGIDARGRPAPCIEDPKEYLSGIAWKRECHEAHGTRLFETTSAQFANGTIFDEIEKGLRARGQCLRALSTDEINARLTKGEHDAFIELIASFIAHWKSSRIPFDTLMDRGSPRDRAFLPICKRVFDEYTARLVRDRRVDFDDLIIGATEALQNTESSSSFRLVLVDEFQDISRSRAAFIRAILAQHDDSVLFCVGDDWQAINGFAGADLSIMRNFEEEFGPCIRNNLTHTFRSNQGISTAAKRFVERNPAQLKKDVVAHDKTANDCLRIVRYGVREKLPEVYEAIARELASMGDCSLKILGRYKKNERSISLDVFSRIAPRLRVEYKTIHGSKGLEADYVILDSLEARGGYAFPSTISDDSILRLVMPEKEPFPHAEERRLMYVALTRAKRRVFILVPDENASPFSRELMPVRIQSPGEAVYACPFCKNGRRVQRTGKHGAFWSCSRYPDCEGKARRRP